MLNIRVTRKQKVKYREGIDATNRRFMPSAAKLLEGEAKTRCPRKTGTLRGSITSKNDNETATVFTNTEYAPYVEYGTVRQSAQPYMRPAIDSNRKRLIEMYRKIFKAVFRG